MMDPSEHGWQSLIDQLNVGVILVDADLKVLRWNRYLEVHSGVASREIVNTCLPDRFPEIDQVWLAQKVRCVFLLKSYAFSSWRERPYLFRLELHRPLFGEPEVMRQDVTFIPVSGPSTHEVESVAIVLTNAQEAFHYQTALAASVGELQAAYETLRTEVATREAMESELRRVHHLDALGRLAGGIAHEINTPLQFTTDGVAFVEESLHGLLGAVDKYARACRADDSADGPRQSPSDAISKSEQEDLDYFKEAAPQAIDTIRQGLERVTKIVQSMKDFAREESSAKTDVDINAAIENAIAVAHSAFAGTADLTTELGPVPPVRCEGGAFKLTMLNLIINAAHAIEDAAGEPGARGRIRVTSRADGNAVEITVCDNGCGIPQAVRAKVFDPFFTTKEVGRGSGQGLALAYSTVVKQHGGQLTFETEVGKGTTFIVRLPIAGDRSAEAPALVASAAGRPSVTP
jgi:two-component system, NtrC family, sensor kinase